MTAFMRKAALFLSDVFYIFKKHKIITSIVSVFLVLAITASVIIVATTKDKNTDSQEEVSLISSEETESEEIVSSEVVESTVEPSSEITSDVSSIVSSKPVSSNKKPATTPSKTPSSAPTTKPNNTAYKYNSNTDINDNVFLDAMVYTGYNLKKHIADGNMWVYILASQKRGLGYLSKITYAGGSTGYETKNGKPDIGYFERRGLVCASYVTYVYFNYLPNVAGIDTSSLTRPVKSYSANDWYIAAKDWVKKGYSKTISFKASKTSSGYIKFSPSEEIPIGSLMFCCDARNRSDYCSHVSIFAGYKNGYHWVYHVGNANGPEFCAMERMHFGPDPQWPINVITTPSNIRMQAALEITLKDDSGNPITGSGFSLKNTQNGKTYALGNTNAKGVIVKENLPYGKYQLIQTVPQGYTANQAAQTVTLTTANNSYNKVSVVNTKIKPVEPSVPQPTLSGTSSASPVASPSQGGASSLPTSSLPSSSDSGSSSGVSSDETSTSQPSSSSDTVTSDQDSSQSGDDNGSKSINTDVNPDNSSN